MPSFSALSAPESVTGLLLDTAIKGLVITALAMLVALLMRKQSGARRHLVWSLSATALVALPILSMCLPAWQIPLPASWSPTWDAAVQTPEPANASLRSHAHSDQDERYAPDTRAVSNLNSATPAIQEVEASTGARVTSPSTARESDGAAVANPGALDVANNEPDGLPAPEVNSVRQLSPSISETPGVQSGPTHASSLTSTRALAHWLPNVWLAGAMLVLLIPAVGLWQVARLQRASEPLRDEAWQSLLQQVAAELCIARRIRLLRSARTRMTITWGLLRPVVLLPIECDGWDESRRRMVLLHELAHVKRLDWLTQMIGQMACAVHWFNPLAWLVGRRMQVHREQACDDMVLRAGASPKEYALELLHLASRLRLGSFSALAAVPMARRSSLEQRVRAILDGSRRRGSLTWMALANGIAICCCVLIPLAMMQRLAAEDAPSAPDQPAPPTPVHISSDGLTALFVHDGFEVDYAFLYVGNFDSATGFEANAEDGSWKDKGTIQLAGGRKIAFERASSKPEEVRINGLRARLKNGRVFLVKQDLEAPNAQQVRQFDIPIPMITKENLEDVFALAHQPGYLRVTKIGFAGEYPPGSGKGRSLSLYARHDNYRTRFALIHSSGAWEIESNDTNNPGDGSWHIDVAFKLPTRRLRVQCDSQKPDELQLGAQRFDLTKGRVIEITAGGSRLKQHAQFPRVLRERKDLLALYTRIAGIESSAVTLDASNKLQLPGGVTAEITRNVFHGADVMTKAALHWPASDDLPALRYEVHVAADAFGNRDHWAAAWERGTSRLWIVNTGLGLQYPNLQVVDFADPRRILTWSAYGAHENKAAQPDNPRADAPPRVPGEIFANLATKIPRVSALKSRGRHFRGKHVDAASLEEQFVVQGTVRGLDQMPIKGMLIQVFTELHPTTRVISGRTNADGRYRLMFRVNLRTLETRRGLMVRPLAAGLVDHDFARAGHLTMKLTPNDAIELPANTKPLAPGQPATVDFLMEPSATIEGRIVNRDKAPWANAFMGVQFPGQREGHWLASVNSDAQGRFRLTNVPTNKRLILIALPQDQDRPIQLGQFTAQRTVKRQRLMISASDDGWSITQAMLDNPVRVRVVYGRKEVTPPSNLPAFADKVIAWAESCRVNRADILEFNPDVWDDVLAGHTFVHVALDTPRSVNLVGVDGPLPITEMAFAMYALGPGAMYVKSGDRVVCLNHWTLERFRPVITEPALQAETMDWYKRLINASRKDHAPTEKTANVRVDASGKLHFGGQPVELNNLTKTLRAAGYDRKTSAVILRTDPDVEIKELHWPLWKLNTSRWESVQIVFDAKP